MIPVSQAIATIEHAGFRLTVSDGQLKVNGKAPLTDAQRQFVKANKQRIIAKLSTLAELTETATDNLSAVVRRLVDDCLDWYVEDQAVIAEMDEVELEHMVLDYLSKRGWYRRGLMPASMTRETDD